MIIECPECSTQYDIKAVLPCEGRFVRCVKCYAIWRVMLKGRRNEGAHSGPGRLLAGSSAVNVRHDDDRSAAALAARIHGRKKTENNKVLLFSAFRRKKELEKGSAGGAAKREIPAQAQAEATPFTRAAEACAGNEFCTPDDVQEAVRSVFSNLADSPASVNRQVRPSPLAARAKGGEERPVLSAMVKGQLSSVWRNMRELDGICGDDGFPLNSASSTVISKKAAPAVRGDHDRSSSHAATEERGNNRSGGCFDGECEDPDAALRYAIEAAFRSPSRPLTGTSFCAGEDSGGVSDDADAALRHAMDAAFQSAHKEASPDKQAYSGGTRSAPEHEFDSDRTAPWTGRAAVQR
jgi:predicted Zn finger-like uncharacterized protein